MVKNQERYNCPNCGAPIDLDSHICAYCGTQFEWKWNPVPLAKIEIVRADVVPIYARLRVPANNLMMLRDCYGKDETEGMLTRQVIEKLMPAIAENVEIRSMFDPERMEQDVMATLLIGRRRR